MALCKRGEQVVAVSLRWVKSQEMLGDILTRCSEGVELAFLWNSPTNERV